MEKPLISYVVTAYNIEKYIEESVQCAFDQTYFPLEIVLSDDCSTDRTYEIMERMAKTYKGPHSIVLNRNAVNLGITGHMNKAYLELASGDLIVAAHGDDISLPERTEKSWAFLSQHQDFTAISFSIDAFNEKGERLKRHSAIVDQPHFYDFHSGGNIPAPSRCFYKKVMTIFGPLSKDCPTEDELISFRALMIGKNAFLPEHLVYYRKHAGSSSNPENFHKFPLEKILEQQEKDMQFAVKIGLISEQQMKEKYGELLNSILIRKRYRQYFADPTIKNLWNLIAYDKVPFRRKVHYLKMHFVKS